MNLREKEIIGYKDIGVLKGMFLVPWHPKLVAVLIWLLGKYPGKVLITCGYEKRDYPSTHSTTPLRAIDIRSWYFKNPEEIEKQINDAFIYDPDRPEKKVCLYHDTGKGWHFHIQVHDRTQYRGKGG